MRKAVAARQFTLRVPTHKTLPPLISLSGHRPIQDANAEGTAELAEIRADLSEKGLCNASADSRDLGKIDTKGALQFRTQDAVAGACLGRRCRAAQVAARRRR